MLFICCVCLRPEIFCNRYVFYIFLHEILFSSKSSRFCFILFHFFRFFCFPINLQWITFLFWNHVAAYDKQYQTPIVFILAVNKWLLLWSFYSHEKKSNRMNDIDSNEQENLSAKMKKIEKQMAKIRILHRALFNPNSWINKTFQIKF